MEKQITEKTEWLSIVTEIGTEIISAEYLPTKIINIGEMIGPEDENFKTMEAKIKPHIEGNTVHTIEKIFGYGAKLSSENLWTVFETYEEAEDYLDSLYEENTESEEDSFD